MPQVSLGDPYQPQDFLYDNWSQRLAPAYQQALQSIYGRGLDVSAPDSLVDAAFPRATSARLLQGHSSDLMRGAEMFRSGQAPNRPDMVVPGSTWMEDGEGGTDSGVSPANAVGQITGFDPTTAMIALQVASAVPGTGPVGTIAGIPGALSGLASMLGVSPTFGLSGNMTQNTSEGPVSVAPTYSGLMSALANAFSGKSNFAAVDPSTGQMTTAAPQPGITMGIPGTPGHPAFGHQGFNAPSQTPNPDGNINITGAPRGDNAPTGGPPGPPGPPGVGPPGLDDGGMGGVPSGPAGPSGPGPGDPSGTGPGGPASSSDMKKGGVVSGRKSPKDTHKGFARKKGTEVVPINAHQGEFVVNKNATNAARPELEALNRLIPDGSNKRAALEDLVRNAAKYFDVS